MAYFKDFSKIFDDFSELAATKNSIEITIRSRSETTNIYPLGQSTPCVGRTDPGGLLRPPGHPLLSYYGQRNFRSRFFSAEKVFGQTNLQSKKFLSRILFRSNTFPKKLGGKKFGQNIFRSKKFRRTVFGQKMFRVKTFSAKKVFERKTNRTTHFSIEKVFGCTNFRSKTNFGRNTFFG